MIDANLRLVVRIAKDYSNPGMTLSDLVAEGNLGLMRAVEEFDPDAGVRFSTYAAWWIKQSIRRAMINAGQPIHIPTYLSKLVRKWRRTARMLEEKLSRPVTNDEVAAQLGLSPEKAEIVLQGIHAVGTSSQMAGDDVRMISEVVADDDESPDHHLLQECDEDMLQSFLDCLDDRERKIIQMRYGLGKHKGATHTCKEIGKVLNLTRERVRQIAINAMTKMQARYKRML